MGTYQVQSLEIESFLNATSTIREISGGDCLDTDVALRPIGLILTIPLRNSTNVPLRIRELGTITAERKGE